MSSLKDKIALQRFRELNDRIGNATGDVPVNESAREKADRIKRLLGDYNAFVKYYFPHYAQVDCADFHIKAARKVHREKNLKGAFKWHRGAAKSTHFDVMIPMWLKAQKDLRVMVLVGKNLDNAETLLSDLQAEFQSNQKYIADFGEQMKYGSWEEGRFVTRDDCAFFALGRGQSPRGLRHRQFRPDYIVMDDIDDDELCRNPDRVRKVVEWCMKALFFTTDMGRGRFIIVGNLISKNSVLAALSAQEGFHVNQVNVLDSKGRVSWKAKYSLKEINELQETLGSRVTQQELFNNPVVEGAVFKAAWMRFGPIPNLKDMDALVSYCDPSFKHSSTSDYKAIITVGRKGAQLYVVNAFVRKCSINEMVRWWYNFHEGLPKTVICDYFMEANFTQDMILEEFTQEGISRGYQLPLRPDKRAKPDKFARIEAMSPLFERGLVTLNERMEKDRDFKQFIDQLLGIEKGSRINDDAPDAMEGAVWQLNRMSRNVPTNYVFHQRPQRRF